MTDQEQQLSTTEARTLKATENMQRDIRGIYLLLQIWMALFVIGAIIFAIVAANS